MLENNLFLGIVLVLLTLYEIKCWRETLLNIHLPENQFLFIIGGLSWRKGILKVAMQMSIVMGPAIFYASVISIYSVLAGTWHVGGILLLQLFMIFVASSHVFYRLRYPNEIVVKSSFQVWLSNRFKNSFAYIAIETLRNQHFTSLLVHKLVVIGMMSMTMLATNDDLFSEKGLALVFLSYGVLQCMLAYQLRYGEDHKVFSLRNLPVPRHKRFLAYLLAAMVLFLPESLCVLFIGKAGLVESLLLMVDYLLISIFFFMMGVSMLYYRDLPSFEFIKFEVIAFLLMFVFRLYGMPLWSMALIGLAISFWVFMDEFDRWNGVES